MSSKIMYIERKGGGDTGPARIGRVSFSKTGRTLYYGDQAFRSLRGAGVYSNYFAVDSGEEYWISGCKREGGDRHRFARQREPVEIDEDVREEYWTTIRELPRRRDETDASR